ncbi:MAG: hypothetical protein EBS29_05100 [Chloroflexia bacterium]|nr:hypothetical protein [Chloroflexia bacterium]
MQRFLPFWLGLLLITLVSCGFAPGSTTTNIPNDTRLLSERVPNPRLIGAANAPIKIIEFSDYQ